MILPIQKKTVPLQIENAMQKVVNAMDKNSFGTLLDSPSHLNSDQWDELRQLRDQFPHCAPLQVMMLAADKRCGVPLWERLSLPRVLLYMNDAARLYEQLDQVRLDNPPHPVPDPTSQVDLQRAYIGPSTEVRADESFDVLQEINSFQEVSFKTAPKSVILANFLENDDAMHLSERTFEDVPVQELAKNSISLDSMLESETLAVVLEKQGKIREAIAMYEKLIRNNPEKNSTFAIRISALKAQLTD